MSLPARQADLATAITDLRTCITNCDTDINAADPDQFSIARIREEAMSALGSLGFSSGEPT